MLMLLENPKPILSLIVLKMLMLIVREEMSNRLDNFFQFHIYFHYQIVGVSIELTKYETPLKVNN